MYPFFETIKIEQKQALNLKYHQERVNRTFNVFFPEFEPLQLEKLLKDYPPENGLLKCKLSYNGTFYNIETQSYQAQLHDAFKVVDAQDLDYTFKYTDRSFFEETKAKYPNFEIIFVQDGLITDTTYSNIVFKSRDKWMTPASTLLKGTQRERLLNEGLIHEVDITLKELKQFEKFKLINAMMDLDHPTEYYTDMIEF